MRHLRTRTPVRTAGAVVALALGATIAVAGTDEGPELQAASTTIRAAAPPTLEPEIAAERRRAAAAEMAPMLQDELLAAPDPEPEPEPAPEPEPHTHEPAPEHDHPEPEPAPAAPSGSVWDRLAECESNGNWASTVGTYEGGLQFHPRTWDAYKPSGYPGAAYEASRGQQIVVAEMVLADQGWEAWPACSRELGLR